MDVFKEYATAVAKSQTRFGLLLFISTLICSILMTTTLSGYYSKDRKAFKCTKSAETVDLANTLCYRQYAKENNSPFPQMSFAMVNGFAIIGLWISYAIYASPRIRKYIRQNEMLQHQDTTNLLCSYGIHILLRIVFLGVMIFLLLFLQKFKLPSSFPCSLEQTARNTTKLSCTDAYSAEKSRANVAMLAFDGALLLLSAIEGIYLPVKIRFCARAHQRRLDDTFLSYLIDETAEDGPSLTLDEYFRRLRQEVLDFTERGRALFPNPERSTLKMDDIYTNVVIQQGRAKYKLDEMGRQDVLAMYPEPTGVEVNRVQEIFQPQEDRTTPPKTILVNGRAGIGKSLFCHKLLRDWAKDNLFSRNFTAIHGEFKFVSILKFIQINGLKTILTLYDLLKASVLSSDLDLRVYKYILRHPDQLLILFDGLDEFDHYRNCADDEQSYINDVNKEMPVSALYGKIMKGKFLRRATIVTTSRPAALNFVGELEFDRVVEILGFSPKQVQEYIERFCGNDKAMCEAIIRHVFDNENILSFCYLPVNCMLICSYLDFKLSEGALLEDSPVLPTTLTDMYDGVLRMFRARHNHSRRANVEGFSADGKETLAKLCDLAMNGIREMKLTFLRSEFTSRGFSENDIQELTESGLLHCLPAVRSGPLNVDTQYCFIHLTVQEFLAAHRVKTSFSTEDISTSVMLGTHWDIVVQFFCGLEDTSPDSVRSVLCRLLRLSPGPGQSDDQVDDTFPFFDSVEVQVDADSPGSGFGVSTSTGASACSGRAWSSSSENKFHNRRSRYQISEWSTIETIQIRSNSEMHLLAIKCLYEAQNRDIVREISHTCFLSDVVDLSGLGITPGDCPAIKYYLLETSEAEQRVLQLKNNNITASGCRTLAQFIAVGAGPTEMLDISNNSIGDEGAICVSQALATSERIPSSLNLSQNGITTVGAKGVADVLLRFPQVQDLDMGYNKLGSDGACVISTLVSSPWCGITRLGIAGNAVGNRGVTQVCSSLLFGSFTLVDLDLRSNGISSNGCSSLADILTHPQCSIETLALSGNRICNPDLNGLRKLANSFRHGMSKICNLQVCDCGISLDSSLFLSAALGSEHCNVRVIDLSSNQIGDEGCKFLSLVALSRSRVVDINLDRNEISDEGARWLLRALESPDCRLRSLSLCDNNISQSLEVDLLNAWGEEKGGLYLI